MVILENYKISSMFMDKYNVINCRPYMGVFNFEECVFLIYMMYNINVYKSGGGGTHPFEVLKTLPFCCFPLTLLLDTPYRQSSIC